MKQNDTGSDNKMQVAVRVDASIEIGAGHLMRCLTLADALKSRGVRSHFFSRQMPAKLANEVKARRHALTILPPGPPPDGDGPPHFSWLGTNQEFDAQTMLSALPQSTSLVIVDHYALDYRWHVRLRAVAPLMAIDDLADRRLECDLLLDQNFLPQGESRYKDLTPGSCLRMVGINYALLRPEYRTLRKMHDRTQPANQVLVFFGGADASNLTLRAMRVLAAHGAGRKYVAHAVVGPLNPHLRALQEWNESNGAPITLHTGNVDFPNLMSTADLAIGAGGSATWERCCLGIPSIVVITAANQRQPMLAAEKAGLIVTSEAEETAMAIAWQGLLNAPDKRQAMSLASMSAVDGCGAERVAQEIGATVGKVKSP